MHTADILNLLPQELDRLTTIRRHLAGFLTQVEAARILALSERCHPPIPPNRGYS